MLNTYIKNRGYTKTILHNGTSHDNHNAVNELKWDADYDGDMANIHVTSNTNGDKKKFNIKLDNKDLESILNIPSVDMPIHKRLKFDFSQPRNEPQIIRIELPQIDRPDLIPIQPQCKSELDELQFLPYNPKPHKKYLSTPLPDEELVLPFSIDDNIINKYPLKPRRNNKFKKTHNIFKVYKKHKTTSKTNSNHKTTSKSKKSNKFTRNNNSRKSSGLTFF